VADRFFIRPLEHVTQNSVTPPPTTDVSTDEAPEYTATRQNSSTTTYTSLGAGTSASTVTRSTVQKNPAAQTATFTGIVLGFLIPIAVAAVVFIGIMSLAVDQTEVTSEFTTPGIEEFWDAGDEEYGEYEEPDEYRFEVDPDEVYTDSWRYQLVREMGFSEPYIWLDDLKELDEQLPEFDFTPLIRALQLQIEQVGFDFPITENALALALESGVLDAEPDYQQIASFTEERGWFNQDGGGAGFALLASGEFEQGLGEQEIAELFTARLLDPGIPRDRYFENYMVVEDGKVQPYYAEGIIDEIQTHISGEDAWDEIATTVAARALRAADELDYQLYLLEQGE
jgi:hypothetical protein